jgi:hypothetical protein
MNGEEKKLDNLKGGRAILATNNLAHRRIFDERVAVLKQPTAQSYVGGMVELAAPRHRQCLGREGRKLIGLKYTTSCSSKI